MRKILVIALVTVAVTSGCIGTFEPSAGEVSDLSSDGHSEIEYLNGTLIIGDGTRTDRIQVQIQNASNGWTTSKEVNQNTESNANQSDTDGMAESFDEDATNEGNTSASIEQNANNTSDENMDSSNNGEESVSESLDRQKLHEVVNGTVLLESARILRELPESEYDLQNVGPGKSVSNYTTYRIELDRDNRQRIIQVHREYWYPLTTNITEGNSTVKSVKLNVRQIGRR